MSMHIPSPLEIVPQGAPFSEAQRKWLNAFFLDALSKMQFPAALAAPTPDGSVEDDSTPWKDPSMAIEDRMVLASGRPLKQKMMAAMAQQDCGQCGYNCTNYALAIVEQAEPRLNLCVPGGKTTARMLKTLVEEMGGGVIDPDEIKARVATMPRADKDASPGRSRANPVEARLVDRRRLNGEGSTKTTMHVEIDLSDCGLDYEAGDSLGVFPHNAPELADAVIAAIAAPPDFPIAGKPLRDVLIEEMSLGTAPDALFQLISHLTGGERRKKAQALSHGEDPEGDAATLDVLAALEKFPGIRPDPEAFIEVLEPMQPRLYSISSSPKANPGRVTLTVDMVRYEIAERTRDGVASTFLAERADPARPIKVYVQKAHNFCLPQDGDVPIIMVGPGTGVAPFRAFLQERRATGASGGAWLFYGHQRAASDFFYVEEFDALRKAGTLTTLSLAWSRDMADKVYVQQKMIEHGAELFSWLQQGAHFYVCGDAKRMAKDVEAALTGIVSAHGDCSPDQAATYLQALKQEGRYQADVY
jgi:sulfite reductase (NADPH) flavoprotein alpha-component